MDRIQNHMKLIAEMSGDRTTVRLGIVTSYDADNYSCKVSIQPEGTSTGWLPIGAEAVGNGWGILFAPTLGDMVEVRFQDDIDSGYVSKRFFNDEDKPPVVPSGEFHIIHKSGSFFKFLSDGTVRLESPEALIFKAPSTSIESNVTITGNLHTTEDIIADGDVADAGGTKTMAGMRQTYKIHKHGTGPTPTPAEM